MSHRCRCRIIEFYSMLNAFAISFAGYVCAFHLRKCAFHIRIFSLNWLHPYNRLHLFSGFIRITILIPHYRLHYLTDFIRMTSFIRITIFIHITGFTRTTQHLHLPCASSTRAAISAPPCAASTRTAISATVCAASPCTAIIRLPLQVPLRTCHDKRS